MKSNSFQAIYVMWLRDMKRLSRSKGRVLGTLMRPVFFLVSMGFGLRSGFSFSGVFEGLDYLDFLAPGMIAMAVLFDSTFAGLSVLQDKEFGFLKEIMVSPVKRWVIVLGRISGGVTTALFQGFFLLIISLFLGFKISNPWNILLAFLFMLLISICFISFGIAIASKMEDTTGFSMVVQFILFPVLFLSGAFSPISSFPKILRLLSFVDPLTYGVDGLRASLIGVSQFSSVLNLLVLSVFGFFAVLLATFLFINSES